MSTLEEEEQIKTVKYKPKDFAIMAGVSVKTLQRWDRDGILVAHRTLTDRRYYTYDQYLSLNRGRNAYYKNMITRGQLYTIIRNALAEESEPGADNKKYLQLLINEIMDLPTRWSDGSVMEQAVKFDADLILKKDAIDALNKVTDEYLRHKGNIGLIWATIHHRIDETMNV